MPLWRETERFKGERKLISCPTKTRKKDLGDWWTESEKEREEALLWNSVKDSKGNFLGSDPGGKRGAGRPVRR